MSGPIAGLIAHAAFWILLAYGAVWREIGGRWIVACVLLWAAARFGLGALPYGEGLFPAFLALLDIVLVLKIFKGDVGLI